jgi:hypothetical protein
MEWIRVEDRSPEKGQIVVAWLARTQEPVCVRFDIDRLGPIWTELVAVDRYSAREDLISHWMPLPEPPNESE